MDGSRFRHRVEQGASDDQCGLSEPRQIFLSDVAFRQLEDWLRETDETELKVAKEKAQVELESHSGLTAPDPYSPFAAAAALVAYPSTLQAHAESEAMQLSTSALPLTAHPGPAGSPWADESKTGFYNDNDGSASVLGSEAYAPSAMLFSEKPQGTPVDVPAHETVEVVRTTSARRWWVILTWLTTWWVPDFVLRYVGRIKRPDIRMAWREKVLIKCAGALRRPS